MSLPTFWTCEMRHEESGIWALDRQHWPQTSLSVVCKDRCVRTGECSSGSAGRLEKWVIAFPFDVLGYNYCMPLMWVSIGCQVEQLLFSPVCQVDSIWIIIRSKRPFVFHRLWANVTSDLWGGSSRQPSPTTTATQPSHFWQPFISAMDGVFADRRPDQTQPRGPRGHTAQRHPVPEHVKGKCREISQDLARFEKCLLAHVNMHCVCACSRERARYLHNGWSSFCVADEIPAVKASFSTSRMRYI